MQQASNLRSFVTENIHGYGSGFCLPHQTRHTCNEEARQLVHRLHEYVRNIAVPHLENQSMIPIMKELVSCIALINV